MKRTRRCTPSFKRSLYRIRVPHNKAFHLTAEGGQYVGFFRRLHENSSELWLA